MAKKGSFTIFLQQQEGAPSWTKVRRRRSLNGTRIIIYVLSVRMVRERMDAWARHVDKVDSNMKDDFANFQLMLDLIYPIVEQHGNQ